MTVNTGCLSEGDRLALICTERNFPWSRHKWNNVHKLGTFSGCWPLGRIFPAVTSSLKEQKNLHYLPWQDTCPSCPPRLSKTAEEELQNVETVTRRVGKSTPQARSHVCAPESSQHPGGGRDAVSWQWSQHSNPRPPDSTARAGFFHSAFPSSRQRNSGQQHHKVTCWKQLLLSNRTGVILKTFAGPQYTWSFPPPASAGNFFPSPPSCQIFTLKSYCLRLPLNSIFDTNGKMLKICSSVL